jgi:hypothetical protein
MAHSEIRVPTCRSEEAGEQSEPVPERRHVPKGKGAKRPWWHLSVMRSESRSDDASCLLHRNELL